MCTLSTHACTNSKFLSGTSIRKWFLILQNMSRDLPMAPSQQRIYNGQPIMNRPFPGGVYLTSWMVRGGGTVSMRLHFQSEVPKNKFQLKTYRGQSTRYIGVHMDPRMMEHRNLQFPLLMEHFQGQAQAAVRETTRANSITIPKGAAHATSL